MKKTFLTLFMLISACQKPAASDQDIYGGIYITEKSANPIENVFPIQMGGGLCTATAVSANTILTAAHCVEEIYDRNRGIALSKVCIARGKYKGKCSTQVKIPDEYYLRSGASSYFDFDYGYDFALVVFQENTFATYFSVKSSEVAKDTEVDLVGNSPQENTSTERIPKRWGKTRIFDFDARENNSLISSGAAASFAESRLTGGDSGGPMFSQCEIVGVASRGSDGPASKNYHTNLTNSKVREKVKELAAATNGAVCGISEDSNLCNRNLVEEYLLENEVSQFYSQLPDDPTFPCFPKKLPLAAIKAALVPAENADDKSYVFFSVDTTLTQTNQGSFCFNTTSSENKCNPQDPSAKSLVVWQNGIVYHPEPFVIAPNDSATITFGGTTRIVKFTDKTMNVINQPSP